MPVLLAATTGMRRGEVLALHWRDLDLGVGRLTVRRTVEQTKSGLRFKEPKTKGSRRTITLPAITIEALARHKAQQAEERMQLGLGKCDLVFTRWDGEPVNPRNFTKEFSRCVRAAGTRPIGFHGLRHTHLSHLMASGVPVKVVAERAGHASAKMTLDVYGHVLPGMQEDVARQVDAALRGVLKG
jgi:integrase